MPKELFGQALTYLRNQFEHLLVYLDDVSAHHRHGVRGADEGDRSRFRPSVRSAAGPA